MGSAGMNSLRFCLLCAVFATTSAYDEITPSTPPGVDADFDDFDDINEPDFDDFDDLDDNFGVDLDDHPTVDFDDINEPDFDDFDDFDDEDQDCMLTPWSEWGECSNSCGKGAAVRTREIIMPINGKGQACKSIQQTKECNHKTWWCEHGVSTIVVIVFYGVPAASCVFLVVWGVGLSCKYLVKSLVVCCQKLFTCHHRTDNQHGNSPPWPLQRVTTSNVHTLFHMTSLKSATDIFATGRMKRGKSGMLGGGIYFAPDQQGARAKGHHKGIMLECQVELGKVKEVTTAETDLTFQKLCEEGYDSVKWVRRKSKTGVEYCVYNWDQVCVQGAKCSTCDGPVDIGATGLLSLPCVH
eukprot:TRINITY_DN66031_c1_g1_i1.p1 TRINITY_DN66031_c1_g1~~TRINITY_DN66031_c1_g1_i1.p1  ORF type:complete len:354 (-),score=49.17 TRINITY_DN66031_c1_g1_i1:202-1263(-)